MSLGEDAMSESVAPEKGRRRTTIAVVAAVLAALVIPLSALGRILGLWGPLPIMLVAFLVTFIGILVAIILGLIGVLRRQGRPWNAYQVRGSLFALVVGVIVAIPVASFVATGLKYPPIHDHTTNPDNPPRFVTLLVEREATNSPNTEEPNPAIIPQQKAAFPDLKPVEIPVPPAEAFTRALDAAKAMEWRIAAAVPEEGRIEAVDVTFWSGFIDDVVIRVTPVDDTHSVIDVRSLSRVGGGDVGKNGLRIREYLLKLKK